MAYYRIEFLTKKEGYGYYTHLPIGYPVTTDLKQANECFDLVVKNLKSQYGNEFEYVKDVDKTIMGTIRTASFSSDMAGYRKGDYLVNLREYSYNPFE